MAPLSVYWNKHMAGTLIPHKRGRLQFQYSQAWLEMQAPPISISLPCQKEKHSPGVSTAFFENLLPENNARPLLAFNHRFDKKDTFAFLEHFGEDCAGALSIMPEGTVPDFSSGNYADITEDLIQALDRIKADPENHQLFPEMDKARLSIAGAQDKLPVHIQENKFFLPNTSGSATTHIIKPASPYFPDIQRNEAFCMDLANQIGLRIPDSKLIILQGHELYAVKRYDRHIKADGTVLRHHQEDFCQAMGIPVNRKYQEGGGPGFPQCRRLVEEHLFAQGPQPRLDIIRVTLFNYLIGNHDAHGKNFAILYGEPVTLAPFYDLLSTQVYPGLDDKFAMSVGTTFRHDQIGEAAFKLFARDMGIRTNKLAELMEAMIHEVTHQFESLLTRHESRYGHAEIYSAIKKTIGENSHSLEQTLNGL